MVTLREGWLWILGLFAVANVAAHLGPGGDALAALNDYNPILLVAYAVIARCVFSDRSGAPIDRATIITFLVTAAALAVVGLARFQEIDGLIAFGIGLILLYSYGRRDGYIGAAIVFLALSTNLFWGELLFTLLKTPIILADSVFAELALRIGGYQVVRDANGLQVEGAGQHAIMVIGACSAFNNISLAALACVSVLVAVRGRLVRQDIWPILVVSLVILVLNSLRLALYAVDRSAYDYWHGGPGAETFALAQTALLVFGMVCVASTARANPA